MMHQEITRRTAPGAADEAAPRVPRTGELPEPPPRPVRTHVSMPSSPAVALPGEGAGRIARIRALLTPAEWRRTLLMFGFITLLHVVGFGIFVFLVVPEHYKGLGIGVAVLAYTLGMRHAFDADHISAIDNTTRKLMQDGQRPLSVGFFFSLGHSTIVVAIGAGIVVAEKAVFGAVSNPSSTLEQFGGVFGTIVSASFLFLIAALNLVILAGIVKVWRSMRRGAR